MIRDSLGRTVVDQPVWRKKSGFQRRLNLLPGNYVASVRTLEGRTGETGFTAAAESQETAAIRVVIDQGGRRPARKPASRPT